MIIQFSIELELNDKSKMLSEIYYISHGLWLYCSKHLSLYCWNKLNSYWKKNLHEVRMENGASLKAKTVIVATGARWREMNVPGEKEFRGKVEGLARWACPGKGQSRQER